MRSRKKLNDGCLKIFHFLKLLYEDRAFYSDVIEIFKDEINEQSSNNIQVTLNKYINTLKVFGIKIKKEKNKYKLESSLYSVNLALEDLKALNVISSSAKNLPDEDLMGTIESFLKAVELRMNSEDKTTMSMISTNSYDFSFYYADIKKQIENCENLCEEHRVLDITYTKDGEEISCKCVAKEVVYDHKNVYLKVHDNVKHQALDIPINNILSISLSPNRINTPDPIDTTVVYRLKGALAKRYKLKENEYSKGLDNSGYLVVVNRNEPFDKLLSRLMRYSNSCEIVSPKYLREEMIKRISDAISNYED